jgi:hypothetical protein
MSFLTAHWLRFMTFLLHFDDHGASRSFSLPRDRSGGPALLSQALDCKEQQRNQGTETSENNAQSEECPKCLTRAVGLGAKFWVVWEEDDGGNDRRRTKCNAMRD